MNYIHHPVMTEEIIQLLVPKKNNALMIDCTLGEGGHSELFLNKYKDLMLIGLDCDETIQKKAIERLSKYNDRFKTVHINFLDFWNEYNGRPVDLILFDLGVSLFHFEESGRGFSLNKKEKLDMRLDVRTCLTAEDIVNGYSEMDLANLFYRFGEEKYSRRIAHAICSARRISKIKDSQMLADIVYKAVPVQYRHRHIHPATKTFQAIRIEVNSELNVIEKALKCASDSLCEGGRMGVISFHSLEDRIVKYFFRNNTESFDILTKKPVVPTEKECIENPPSRSAKLRVIEKRGKK